MRAKIRTSVNCFTTLAYRTGFTVDVSVEIQHSIMSIFVISGGTKAELSHYSAKTVISSLNDSQAINNYGSCILPATTNNAG